MMSFNEFKTSVCATKVAGPQEPTTNNRLIGFAKENSTSSSSKSPTLDPSSTMESTNMKMSKLFAFIDDTYRDIRRLYSGLHKDIYNTQLMQIINKYKNGCNKIFEDVLDSHDMSKKLAQNIARTIDIFKELCTSLTDMEEYQHRVCEMMAIFIACELRLSVDTTVQEQVLIGQRIVYIMRRHLVQDIEEETRYNILRTLVYIPRLFNARDIMCAIFGQFIPIKSISDVNVLPDKLYMLYIIVFYRWMMMQKDDNDKLLIVNFAENFMKPSVTLCTNKLYATHLPRYTTHSTATRTILNNMKFYRDIRNASIIDNALKKIGPIVDLCDEDEDADLIILDSSKSYDFAEIFSSVQVEPLNCSMSEIKLEEKTIIGTVDLTLEEEESQISPSSICNRHENWLNNFQQLAKQFRESQIIMERQQSSQQISVNQNEAIICLDSDSESEDEISAAADSNNDTVATKNNGEQNGQVEDLFVDNYPPTVTPINCEPDLESSGDDDDATKLSSRFLSGTIRTYGTKKVRQMESSNVNIERAYRRDSIHISSTPPERRNDEFSDNQDDDGTDVQDEHDQDENEVNAFAPISLEKVRPRGPYPTYNSMNADKLVFSHSFSRMSYMKEQHQRRPQEKTQNQHQTQQYYSDSSEIKNSKKQKKRVHFNTSPVGPTSVVSLGQTKPLKPALQQSKCKTFDVPDYFHLRGFERFTANAPSIVGSTSTSGSTSSILSINKQQEQQEHTIEKYSNNNHNNGGKYREIKQSFKINHYKCSKNLSVFNQKCLIKQKFSKNVKINLKKLKLNNDISLTNYKSNLGKEKQSPHTTLTLLSNNSFINYKQTETESCQLKANPIENTKSMNVIDDDTIFKKPLPVIKKMLKSPKSFKIHKVVSLRRHSFYFKTKNINIENKAEEEDKHILKIPVVMNVGESQDEIKTQSDKELSLSVENKNKVCELPVAEEMDDLSKISKFLTEEINSLTSELEIENVDPEKYDNENREMNGNTISSGVEEEGNGIISSQKSKLNLINANIQIGKYPIADEKSNETEINLNNLEDKESIEPFGCFSSQHTEKESCENLNDQEEIEKESAVKKTEDENSIKSNEVLNDDTLVVTNELGVIDETNNGTITKENSENSEESNITNDEMSPEKKSILYSNNTEEENCNSLESDTVLNTENEIDGQKLVTQFCAEFLAGLPNEPSSALINVNDTDQHETRNDIDFEFENNCSTPTMCRIDLDDMSENTSDIPTTVPITTMSNKKCEADKLLEDFNNKTEDIVDSALSKKSNASEVITSSIEDHDQNRTISGALLKRCREEEDSIGDEHTSKKYIFSNYENSKKMKDNDKSQNKESLKLSENIKTPPNNECVIMKDNHCFYKMNEVLHGNASKYENVVQKVVDSGYNRTKSVLSNKEVDVLSKSNKFVLRSEDNKSKILSQDSVIKEIITNEADNKSHKKSIHNNEICHETPVKKVKKSNKHTKVEEKVQSSIRENSENIMKSKNDYLLESNRHNTEKLDHNTKNDEEISQQMETSINENQQMTLELGNWKQDRQSETKTDNKESGGVSAIFSFPKIPIISISICTTPNNKTYFKISNQENDKQFVEGGKMKKMNSSTQQENETEPRNDEKVVKIASEDLNYKDRNSLDLDSNEVINMGALKEEQVIVGNNIEENDDDAEDDENEEEEEELEREGEETDNIWIEKYSHDSNSPCSLPLKKRPTQAEPNDELEDLEHVVARNFEKLQEIATEVVIENINKEKPICEDNSSSEVEQIMLKKVEHHLENEETSRHLAPEDNHTDESSVISNDLEENKPSISATCFKKVNGRSSPFKRRVNIPIRPIGQPPIQIVAPQLKDNSPSSVQEHRATDIQVSTVARILTQTTQSLPESYPATPMLSVANVEKLMDFNRFIEDLLASPDVMTIIDNANACGYYAEGQAYEMERIAILEHYNIANAKGNTSVTKPLYWKKSAGDTISIFNDNDNEWITLPPSTAKQLLKLSFVLSILQQQYKVNDVRQRINIALTFLIQTSYTSKFMPNTNPGCLQQRMQVYSRTTSSDSSNTSTSTSHNIPQPLPSTSYFRNSTNNETMNIDSAQDLQTTNYANAQHHVPEIALPQQEPTSSNGNQNWNHIMQFGSTGMEQTATTNSSQHINTYIESEQQHVQQDKRSSCWDEVNNDQLYINPPCASSPQNEVIVNTNGVQLHEMPQNFHDQQNIFISITDESCPSVSNPESSHKYNTRQKQHRTLDELEQSTSSMTSSQIYSKKSCLGNGAGASLIQNFANNNRNNIITTFGNQEINLQNPYRLQQLQQQQQQQQQPQQQHTNQHINTTSPNTNFQQNNISSKTIAQNLPINIYNNARHLNPLMQQQQTQQRMSTRYASTFNSQHQQQQQQRPTIQQHNQTKVNESNYKDILQPYITYLIKDHEKTSRHLLQVFEEVSNSNPSPSNANVNISFTSQQQKFNSELPPLIKIPQQNHMSGIDKMPDIHDVGILPSLTRKPHQTTTMPNRDSGALQVVQSFLDQTQPNFNNTQRQLQYTSTSVINPGFVKEYVNFVGSRDEVLQKQKLRNFNKEQLQQTQQQEQLLKKTQRIKCQERSDKLSDDLKHKIMELSQHKHNVQAKMLEKQQHMEENIEGYSVQNKRRGRPRKYLTSKTYTENNVVDTNFLAESLSNNGNNCESLSSTRGKQRQFKSGNRTRRKVVNSELPSGSTTIDHAYFRQRTAAREAVKRINAAVNNFQ